VRVAGVGPDLRHVASVRRLQRTGPRNIAM